MNAFYILFTFSFLLTYDIALSKKAYAKTTFKGGIIIQSKSLPTKIPIKRKDLIYDLKKFDDSHLNQVITTSEAIRLERRVGIGVPIDRIKLHIGKTRREAINDIISDLDKYQENIIWPKWTSDAIPTSFMDRGIKNHRINCDEQSFLLSLKTTWMEKLVSSKTPQYERLAVFWLNHFSVNFNMYKQTHSFFTHLKIIRENTNKNFLKFLEVILKDPAMIVYLNNEKSYARNPNENLSREFFELFSLGEGYYSEADIKNFARYLSGNSINFVTEKFKIYPNKQSSHEYSAFGKKYKNDEEFFEILKNHPAFGEYIALKFYKEYVDLRNPSSEDLAYLVSYFREHKFNIPEMLRGVLNLKSFWENKLSLVKSPLELFYGTARTFNHSGNPNSEEPNHYNLLSAMTETGQDIFNPPNIAGWPTGKEWLSGQKLEKRITNISETFSNIFNNSNKMQNKNLTAKTPEETYNMKLKEFFDQSLDNQLSVETILLDWIPKDFSTRRYADITAFFYNVRFLGKKWEGIEIRFGTDKNNGKSYQELNRFSFYEGYSSPNIISNWNKSYFSDWRATRGISSSFPLGTKTTRFYQQNKTTRLLLLHLLLAMEHTLKKDQYYLRLFTNPDAKSFLTQRIVEVKKILKINDNSNPTKIFSYPSYMTNYEDMRFQCGTRRYGININNITESKYFRNDYDLKNIDEMKINLSNLLLPDLNLNIDNFNYLKLLTHEGYQLK